MTKNIRLYLILFFILQIAVSMGFELAHDEAYYWLYSKHLDWGFFDHPPFVGLIIKLFSFLPHSEFAVRMGFILLQFLTVFLILCMTAHSSISLLLFFAFPLASFSGLFALPDMGLLFLTACYCYQLKKYLGNESTFNVLTLGVTIALLLYAKYHGILLILFTITAIPSLLRRSSFYKVFLISLLLFLPHVIWQYEHEFSTIRYHFLERPKAQFSVKRIFEYLAVQVGLAGFLVGPVVWKIVLFNKAKNSFDRAMKAISIGTVVFFLLSTFTKKFEANWTIFLAVPLIYLSSSSELWTKKYARRLLLTSVLIVLGLRILLVLPPEWSRLKRLHEFHGWKDWAINVHLQCGQLPLLANSYQVASKLSYYLQQDVGALNYHSRKNQFDYWRFDRKIPTDKVCYVTDKIEFAGDPIFSPDGKSLRLVKNISLQKLWKLKYP